jgi:hypothetical protein
LKPKEITECLNKLGVLGELQGFVADLFVGKLQAKDNRLKDFLYVLITKLNANYISRLKGFKELEYINEKLSSVDYSDTDNLMLCLILMFVLKYKFNITEYRLLQNLQMGGGKLIDSFLSKYLVVNQYSTTKPLEYIDDFFTNYLKLGFKDLKSLYDDFFIVDTISTQTSKLSDFIYFDRHITLTGKLNEIFNIDANAKIMLSGTANSGKTTQAKLFTTNSIIFDIDETIEINVSVYLTHLDITRRIPY